MATITKMGNIELHKKYKKVTVSLPRDHGLRGYAGKRDTIARYKSLANSARRIEDKVVLRNAIDEHLEDRLPVWNRSNRQQFMRDWTEAISFNNDVDMFSFQRFSGTFCA